MEDVRVLVRDELEVPVVDVAERGHIVGRGDVETHGVERKGRGGTVGGVGLVREDDLGALARRPADRGDETPVDGLCQVPHPSRDLILGGVVGDAEVGRLRRAPLELGIVRGQGGARSRDEKGRQQQACSNSPPAEARTQQSPERKPSRQGARL